MHSAVRNDYLDEAINVLELGMGVPSFFNDDTLIHALELAGVPAEQAREYGAVGCIETFIAEQTLAADQPVPLYSCLIPACMTEGCERVQAALAHRPPDGGRRQFLSSEPCASRWPIA